MESEEASRDLALVRSHRDLLIYATGDKYGVLNMKTRSQQYFEGELEPIELGPDMFETIRAAWAIMLFRDRGLCDPVIARVYGGIQH